MGMAHNWLNPGVSAGFPTGALSAAAATPVPVPSQTLAANDTWPQPAADMGSNAVPAPSQSGGSGGRRRCVPASRRAARSRSNSRSSRSRNSRRRRQRGGTLLDTLGMSRAYVSAAPPGALQRWTEAANGEAVRDPGADPVRHAWSYLTPAAGAPVPPMIGADGQVTQLAAPGNA